jgi:hypothetical protein
MKTTVFVLLFTALVFCGCESKDKGSSLDMNVSIDLSKSKTGNYSEFVSELRYFLVETKQPELLVSPYKIIANDSIYYISDFFGKNIVRFDKKTGSYLTIGRPGEGPGENLELDDFSIYGDTIVFYDSGLSKFMEFGGNGQFLNESKSTFYSLMFFQGNGFKLIYNHSDPEIGSRILRVSDQGETQGFVPVEDWFAQQFFSDQNGFVFDKTTQKIYFLLPITNQIAVFNADGFLEKLVQLDFGNFNFGKEDWQRLGDTRARIEFATQNKLLFGVSSFLVLEDSFLIYVIQEGSDKHLIRLNKDFELVAQYSPIVNDLDGVNISSIPWTAYDQKMIFMVNGKELSRENQVENPKMMSKYSNAAIFFEKHKTNLAEDEHLVLIEATIK